MKCFYCNEDSRDYFLFWAVSNPHYCAVYGNEKKLCENHRHATINFNLNQSGYGHTYDLCSDCKNWRDEVAEKIIAVRSSHIGDHDTIEICGYIETKYRHRDMDDAVWEIKYNATLLGANAVLNLKLIPHKEHDGNYIYNVWTVSGNLAIVKNKR